MKPPHGRADYLLFVDGRAVGVVEAKKEGETLTGVEWQSAKYVDGLPDELEPAVEGGAAVRLRVDRRRDAVHEPRSTPTRRAARSSRSTGRRRSPAGSTRSRRHPTAPTLRHRLRDAARARARRASGRRRSRAIANLEAVARREPAAGADPDGDRLGQDVHRRQRRLPAGQVRRRAAHPVPRRPREPRPADAEGVPGVRDARRRPQVHRALQRPAPAPRTRSTRSRGSCISTIQRLYSILRGDAELDRGARRALGLRARADRAGRRSSTTRRSRPRRSTSSSSTSATARSTASGGRCSTTSTPSSIGLTATPEQADVRLLQPEPRHGVRPRAGRRRRRQRRLRRLPHPHRDHRAGRDDRGRHSCTKFRDRQTRRTRWEKLDEDLAYAAEPARPRRSSPRDQIRTVLETFRDRLFTEIFPGRTEVPKTLIFAKDDAHADEIVQIVREEFGKGNDFAAKITYKATGKKADELLAAFRNTYNPRIAVTVDMIATGTDVKPLECVFFMRTVKSRDLLRADEGPRRARHRPTRPPGRHARRDGEGPLRDRRRRRRHRERARRHRAARPQADRAAREAAPARSRSASRDPDVDLGDRRRGSPGSTGGSARHERDELDAARRRHDASRRSPAGSSPRSTPTGSSTPPARRPARDEPDVDDDRRRRRRRCSTRRVAPLADEPRAARADRRRAPRCTSRRSTRPPPTSVIEAGYSQDATDRARDTVESWERFCEEHRDEITALQILYARRQPQRLTFARGQGARRRRSGGRRTVDAREALGGLRGSSTARRCAAPAQRVLTDLVSLVRVALAPGRRARRLPRPRPRALPRLAAPAGERRPRRSRAEQLAWLERIRDHVAAVARDHGRRLRLHAVRRGGGLGKAAAGLRRRPRAAARRAQRGARRVSELPPGWVETTLGEICVPCRRSTPRDDPGAECRDIDIADGSTAIRHRGHRSDIDGRRGTTQSGRRARASDVDTVRSTSATSRAPSRRSADRSTVRVVHRPGFMVLRTR